MPSDTALNPFDLMIFGGTGDLALRKLIPALYHRHVDGMLSEGRILVGARRDLSTADYVAMATKTTQTFLAAGQFDSKKWEEFAQRLQYVRIDSQELSTFQTLATVLQEHSERQRVFYLSTSPDLFGDICENLAKANVINEQARVVLEKPLGHDFASSTAINEQVGRFFKESAIYRIDHYLGKETVQNLLVLRFGNTIFESLWNQKYIDHVEITIAETIGVEERADFYDHTGALRDVLQNHLLQLLCITAMEPPRSLDSDEVSDEKLKVIRSLRPITSADVKTKTVRGQYSAGAINGKAVPSYLEETGISKESRTETFVAIKAEIDNWRWAGVPFYLRTGKRLSKQLAEIVVRFKAIPHSIFESVEPALPANKLVIHLQPDESIQLGLFGKQIGQGMHLRAMSLNLGSGEADKVRVPSAYERLLVDVIAGRGTLFNRRDELDAAWQWVEPILTKWATSSEKPLPYAAGTWGPAASTLLLARDNCLWHEESETS